MACVHHPSATTALILNGRHYCANCVAGMQTATTKLDPHVTPRDCFVWYKNAAEGWQPIAGTGCAHYVAHQLNVQLGGLQNTCVVGFTYRVPFLVTGKTRVTGGLTAVRVNDIWVQTDLHHTGIVSKIEPPVATGPEQQAGPPIVWITHASSRQHRLATNRFDQYFHAQGNFYR